jgi:ribosomal protein S18 acetylase RimI-like enzyme
VSAPLFAADRFRCVELVAADIPRLQAFFEENPEYDELVEGQPPGPNAGKLALEGLPPADMRYTRKWMLGFEDAGGTLVAIADVTEGMLADGVWHIGLFIVATRLHGSGAARAMYDGLQAWMQGAGAQWLRLGVVAGNVRAERFWERLGYVETRRRLALPMGLRVNDIRVMMKPLAGGRVADYLAMVARDRPE